MEWDVKVGGTWHKLVSPAVKVGATWHNIQQGWVKVAGTWKQFFAAFVGPVTHTYNAAGTYSDTIPAGASNVVIEDWGASGSGDVGTGSGCGANSGQGAGSGAYARSSYTVSGHAGQTISITVGTAGAPSGNAGTSSTVSSGTFSVTTMTAPGGQGGNNSTGTGLGGSIATGGNA